MSDKKRLIELALPLKEVSAREKSIRHGRISTVHVWWARRPLAACRAEEITPKLHMIRDPASKLRPKEEVRIVRYMVGGADWKRAAETSRSRT